MARGDVLTWIPHLPTRLKLEQLEQDGPSFSCWPAKASKRFQRTSRASETDFACTLYVLPMFLFPDLKSSR